MLESAEPSAWAAFETPAGMEKLVPGRPASEIPICSPTVITPIVRPGDAFPRSAGLKYAADAPPPIVPGCRTPGPSMPPVRSKRGEALAAPGVPMATPAAAQAATVLRLQVALSARRT